MGLCSLGFFTCSDVIFLLTHQHLSMILVIPHSTAPCNYTFTTQRQLNVGGRIRSMTKQTLKANIILPGRSTLKFPQNYILASILNESPNYFRPVIVCCCSGKRCNYLRQCVSKYVGHNSRAWVERAMQLFLCAAVSGSHHRFHLWLHSWLLNSSNLSTISRGRNIDKTRVISLLCAHEWGFLKPQSVHRHWSGLKQPVASSSPWKKWPYVSIPIYSHFIFLVMTRCCSYFRCLLLKAHTFLELD